MKRKVKEEVFPKLNKVSKIADFLHDLDKQEGKERELTKSLIYRLSVELQDELEQSRNEVKALKKYVLKYSDILEKNTDNIRKRVTRGEYK